uniref:Uncharacterized protein n=1 Tax=Methanococcus maripaludis (strain C6 / ATCC BAA-1332) TaxID=444158 RepID=A9A6U2_METM6
MRQSVVVSVPTLENMIKESLYSKEIERLKNSYKLASESFLIFLLGLELDLVRHPTEGDIVTWKSKVLDLFPRPYEDKKFISFSRLYELSGIESSFILEIVLHELKYDGEIYEPEPRIYRVL